MAVERLAHGTLVLALLPAHVAGLWPESPEESTPESVVQRLYDQCLADQGLSREEGYTIPYFVDLRQRLVQRR